MNVYQSCYDLIQTYIYGGVELTQHMELTTTILATCAAVFVFSIPFLVVFWIIKFLSSIGL